MTKRKFGVFSSSENPEQLALTVKGIIVSLASLIVLVAAGLGFPVSVEQVAVLAGSIGTAVGAIATLSGLIRKIVIAVQARIRS